MHLPDFILPIRCGFLNEVEPFYYQWGLRAETTKHEACEDLYTWQLDSLRGWLHGEISARAGISARLLTYWKEEYNLNKKGSYFNTHFVFLIQINLLFSIR